MVAAKSNREKKAVFLSVEMENIPIRSFVGKRKPECQ